MVDTPTFTASAGGGSPQAAYDAETAKLAEETRKQREIMAKRTRRMMDDEEAISVRRATRASQEQENAERDKANESIKALATGAGVAAVAVNTFVSAMKAQWDRQTGASENTGDFRARMARAGQDMRMDPEAVQQIIRQQESGMPLPGGMTREEDVAMFEAAAATSRRTFIPTQMDQFNRLRNLDISPSAKVEGVGSITPMVGQSITQTGRVKMSELGSGAISDRAMIDASKMQAEASVYGAGANKRKASQDVNSLITSSPTAGAIFDAADSLGIPGTDVDLGKLMKMVVQSYQEQKYINSEAGVGGNAIPLVRVFAPTVPSSGQGLVTP